MTPILRAKAIAVSEGSPLLPWYADYDDDALAVDGEIVYQSLHGQRHPVAVVVRDGIARTPAGDVLVCRRGRWRTVVSTRSHVAQVVDGSPAMWLARVVVAMGPPRYAQLIWGRSLSVLDVARRCRAVVRDYGMVTFQDLFRAAWRAMHGCRPEANWEACRSRWPRTLHWTRLNSRDWWLAHWRGEPMPTGHAAPMDDEVDRMIDIIEDTL